VGSSRTQNPSRGSLADGSHAGVFSDSDFLTRLARVTSSQRFVDLVGDLSHRPHLMAKGKCLKGCINPEEGLHHWRCPNYAEADKVRESLASVDDDEVRAAHSAKRAAAREANFRACNELKARAYDEQSGQVYRPYDDAGGRNSEPIPMDSSKPLEYRGALPGTGGDKEMYERFLADRRYETRQGFCGWMPILTVLVAVAWCAATVYLNATYGNPSEVLLGKLATMLTGEASDGEVAPADGGPLGSDDVQSDPESVRLDST